MEMKNDIENIFEYTPLDISNIGKYEKFVEFTQFKNSYDDVQFVEAGSLIRFKSDTLTCKKISKEEKIKSLKNMFNYLMKHIERETELELSKVEDEITEKLYDKYRVNELRLKISELSLHSS